MAWQKLNYIHNNPVKAGIVEKPEDYLYSSASAYCGMKSLIDYPLYRSVNGCRVNQAQVRQAQNKAAYLRQWGDNR